MWRDPCARGARAMIFQRCGGLLFCCFLAWLLCSAAPAHAQVFRLPDTGQTKCYRDVSPWDEIPCAGNGQHGEYSINTMSLADNVFGAATDCSTDLA